MANPIFNVTAVWDEEAQIWTSESDIQGLHVEAATMDEFNALVREYAGELIIANHYSSTEIATIPLKDLIPTIVLHDSGRITAAE